MNKAKIIKIIIHILIFTILAGILLYVLFGSEGIVNKEKQSTAQEKLTKALQEYSEGKYNSLLEAVEDIDGYKGVENIIEGMYSVDIDGQKVPISTTENIIKWDKRDR